MRRFFSLNPLPRPGLRQLTIQQRMRIGLTLVVAMLALLCGTILANSYARYRQGNADLRAFELVRIAMVAANRVSAERGPTNDQLAHLRGDDAVERRNLAEARERSDAALAAFRDGLAHASNLGLTDPEGLRGALDLIIARLAAARREVDALAAQPSAARTERQIVQVQVRMFGIVDALAPLIDDLSAHATLGNPDVAGALLLARLLGDLREYSGRLGSLFIAPMFLRQPLDRERLSQIMLMRGRIEQLRSLIAGAVVPQLANTAIAVDFMRLNSALDNGIVPLVDQTFTEGRDGRYSTSAADFSRRIVPMFQPSEQLRDRVIESAQARATAYRNLARLRVAISIVATLLSLAILYVLVRSTRRALLIPLDHLRRRIIALSEGDVSPIAVPAGASLEIRHVSEALDTLRRAYVRRNVLERQRDDMLTLFSHDMRAPLTSVIVLVNQPDEAPGACPPGCVPRERLARIDKLARHTLAMADGFAQMSRAEAGEYEPVLVNLADLMNEARDAVWPLAREKAIVIDDVARREDALVRGDPALLSRALINLLANAVKYSEAHTRVECSVELSEDRATVRCVIRDHGYGIDIADQARLFERYRRFRLDGQPETKGVGLGMAFVKAVMERHAGEIRVRSAAWQGTTVTLALPAVEAG